MFVVQYMWVWTVYGYVLMPVRRFVPVYTYAPVFYYYF